jgi:hypothetical protein
VCGAGEVRRVPGLHAPRVIDRQPRQQRQVRLVAPQRELRIGIRVCMCVQHGNARHQRQQELGIGIRVH